MVIRNFCLYKRIWYCPGSGQELLSALSVIEVCQDSRNCLMWKFPLLMSDTLLKSMTRL